MIKSQCVRFLITKFFHERLALIKFWGIYRSIKVDVLFCIFINIKTLGLNIVFASFMTSWT
jgi:hypothetical protein